MQLMTWFKFKEYTNACISKINICNSKYKYKKVC